MRRLALAALFVLIVCATQNAAATTPPFDIPGPQQGNAASPSPQIVLPPGTEVILALASPLWAKSAKPGDTIYCVTTFPVVANNQMAIPAGTYVEGKIDVLTKPGIFSSHAQFQLHFTKMVFANGYVVQLSDVLEDADSPADPGPKTYKASQAAGASPYVTADVEAAVARVYVDVSARSDVLLDNGALIEMLLQTPLALDANSVAAAAPQSTPPQIGPAKSSSRCVPTPGTPGTPDTVIPGTPGTPPTVIPGGPGMPDTVIPGMPGTPPTVIPGTPEFPGTTCPGPPVVTTEPSGKNEHTKTLTLENPLLLGGSKLAAGKYQIRWSGLGPTAQVDFLLNKKQVAQAQARIIILGEKSLADQIVPHANSDGSISLSSLQFAGEGFELVFD